MPAVILKRGKFRVAIMESGSFVIEERQPVNKSWHIIDEYDDATVAIGVFRFLCREVR